MTRIVDQVYLKNYYKVIAVDLSKQEALDIYAKVIQQINFTNNLARERDENATMSFIIEEVQEIALDFSQ